MKILITGGAGFIGSELAKTLVRKGHDILIYDYRSDISSLQEIKENIQIIQGDIRNFENIRRAVIGADGIVHLAAVSRVVWGYENPKECVDININGTANILEAARISVKKPWIIFGSSREVYGQANTLPVTEDFPKLIHNIYGATKIAGETLCEQYHKNYHLNIGILRFSNVYGTKYDQLDRVIPKFILRASNNLDIEVHGGGQLFDFTHISDTVQGIVNMIEKIGNSKNYFDTFHLTTGNGTTLQEVIKYIFSFVKTSSEVKYIDGRTYDVEKFYGNVQKAQNLLDYKPKIDIKTGVKMTTNELLDESFLKFSKIE